MVQPDIPKVQIEESEGDNDASENNDDYDGNSDHEGSQSDDDNTHGSYFSLDPHGQSSSVSQHNNPLIQHLHSRLAPLTSLSSPTVERPTLSPRNSAEAGGIPVYRGSYAKNLSDLNSASSLYGSRPTSLHQNHYSRNVSSTSLKSLRHSNSYVKIKRFHDGDTEIRETYGLEELREGFFDTVFVPPSLIELQATDSAANGKLEEQQPEDKDRLSVRMKSGIVGIYRNIVDIRSGSVLLKAFLAYFIAYILCLIHPTSQWLGKYAFLMPICAIVHHPGRTVGSQLEITLQVIFGEACGLGWSSLALYISTSTGKARSGYGGILAGSIVISLFINSWVRAHYIRFYHGSMAYCIIFILMHIVDVSESVHWEKAWDIGIPYLMGIALSLVISVVILPDVGHIPVMAEFEKTLEMCSNVIKECNGRDSKAQGLLQQQLTNQGMHLSSVIREMTNEFTLSTFSFYEVITVRNKIIVCISRIRAIPNPGRLFAHGCPVENQSLLTLYNAFSGPAERLINELSESFITCKHYITFMKKGGNSKTVEELKGSIKDSLSRLEDAIESVADEYKLLSEGSQDVFSSIEEKEVIDVMLYMHYLYEASKHIRQLLSEIDQLVNAPRKWKLSKPSYPWRRSLKRTTARITHDRGGESAAYYFRSKLDVEEAFKDSYRLNDDKANTASGEDGKSDNERSHRTKLADPRGIRYDLWQLFHRFQDYETRFAIKASITIVLVCIPAWLEFTHSWYARHHLWICSVIAYVALHPRVGGNVGDFFARTVLSISGSLWGGIAYRARYGNPYVLGVFCAIYMIPALYRFLLTGHPRSGVVGCLAFTFVSLGLRETENIFTGTATKLAAVQIGLMVSIFISWIFWPFVARHEVRKSFSSLLSYLSQSYQIVADRYLYKDADENVTNLTLQMSEIREARIIQNMNALDQLIDLTNHEPSLRGNFDMAVYRAMLESCKTILQTVTEARISSVYFNIYEIDRNEEITRQLQSLRRDAAASVIFCFYIVSGAFRSKKPIPRYLPSAVMSRKILFDSIDQLEFKVPPMERDKNHIWKIVHESAFSKAFTDITEELEKIIGFSKHILGEQTL